MYTAGEIYHFFDNQPFAVLRIVPYTRKDEQSGIVHWYWILTRKTVLPPMPKRLGMSRRRWSTT
jgi:hypothetical protein